MAENSLRTITLSYDKIEQTFTNLKNASSGRAIYTNMDLSNTEQAKMVASNIDRTKILANLPISGVNFQSETGQLTITVVLGKELGPFVFTSMFLVDNEDLDLARILLITSTPKGVVKFGSDTSGSEIIDTISLSFEPSPRAGLLVYEDVVKVKKSELVSFAESVKDILVFVQNTKRKFLESMIGQIIEYPSNEKFLPHALSCTGGLYRKLDFPILFSVLSSHQENFGLQGDGLGFFYALGSETLTHGPKPGEWGPVGADIGRMLCTGSGASNYGFVRSGDNIGKQFEDQFKSHLHTASGSSGSWNGSTYSGGTGSTNYSDVFPDYGRVVTNESDSLYIDTYSYNAPGTTRGYIVTALSSQSKGSHDHNFSRDPYRLPSHNHSISVSVNPTGGTQTSPKHIQMQRFCIDDRILNFLEEDEFIEKLKKLVLIDVDSILVKK